MSEANECGALLARSRFFTGILRDLSEEDVATIIPAFRPVRYAAGQHIFSKGDPGDFLLLIAEGRVRLSVMSEDGRELSVRHAVSGDVVGEIAALDGRLRSAGASAITEAHALALHRTDFKAIMERFPIVALSIIDQLCDRLRDTTDQLESIALHPIEVRLARFLLLALAGRRAAPPKRVPLELGFSQSELAQLLGASRPKVNSALRELEERGAIRRTADRLFCDPALLAAIAGSGDDV